MTERIMVDIETLGTDPGAAIVSIGAVRFSTTNDAAGAIEAEFFESVALESCDAYGLDIDGSTVEWWLGQPAGPSTSRRRGATGRSVTTGRCVMSCPTGLPANRRASNTTRSMMRAIRPSVSSGH